MSTPLTLTQIEEGAGGPSPRGGESSSTSTPPPGSLKGLAVRGTAWTVAERAIGSLLRLAGNLVLSRLLFPEAFGMVAIVSVYQQALQMISDVGVGPSVIQHKRGAEPRFLNTAWTIRVLRGLALSVIAVALAWPVATWWFLKPEVAPMLVFAGCVLAVDGFTSMKAHLAFRTMALGPVTRRNLISQVVGLVAMISLASWWRSPWSLVLGALSGSVAQVILSHITLPGPADRFGWEREAASQVFRFGRWVFASTLLTFLSNQGDRFLMGRMLSEKEFGLYNIATVFCMIPTMTVLMLGPRVIFPTLCRLADREPERLAAKYDRLCRMLYLAVMPAIGLLIGIGPLLIDLLYDDRYTGAGWFVRPLAVRATIECLLAPGLSALLALGLPQYTAASQAVKAAVMVVLLPLVFHAFGLTGALAVVALNGLGAVVVVQWALSRRGLANPTRELTGVALALAGAAVGWGLDVTLGPLVR